MSSRGSVSHLIDGLIVGDPDAVAQLWQRYYFRLVGLARKKLQGTPKRASDEEDVAQSAFHSFCRHAEQGRFPDLLDREGLWRLLVTITVRKAQHRIRDEMCLKRGGGVTHLSPADGHPVLEEILSVEPDPQMATIALEECKRLLGLLGHQELQQIALLRMEGYSVEEIAQRMNYAPRSVKRKLKIIRHLWEQDIAL